MVQLQESLANVLRGIDVVDCDSHYTEPPDMWTSRAPAKFKDRVPHLRKHNGIDMWFIDGNTPMSPVGQTVVMDDGHKELGVLGVRDFERLNKATWEVKARVEMLDRLGLWAQIVYPNASGFASATFLTVEDAELRTECVRIYNDAVAEWQHDSGGRLLPQGLLPFWDLDETLKEMRRCKEDLGLVGFTVTDTPEKFGFPDYGLPYWNPFWELASELGTPLNFHIGSGGAKGCLSPFLAAPWESMGPERKMAIGSANIYMDNARMVTNLLYSDVLENYPKLRFVSVESGIGWIPFILEACEYQWDEMVPTECRHHTMRPTEKFQRHIYACFWFEDFGPRTAIDRIGVKNVLFETDFPHPTCLYPRAQEHVANVLRDLDFPTRKAVLQDNATELYGVKPRPAPPK